MTHINFLVNEIFTSSTREGKVPQTLADFDQLYSNKEYEIILRELLTGLGYFEDLD